MDASGRLWNLQNAHHLNRSSQLSHFFHPFRLQVAISRCRKATSKSHMKSWRNCCAMSSVFHPRDLGGTTRGGGSIGGPGMGGTSTGGTGGADNTGTGGTAGTGGTGDMLTKGGGGMAPASPHFSRTPSPFSSLRCGFGSLFVYVFNIFYLFKTYDLRHPMPFCDILQIANSFPWQSHRVVPGA